MTFSVLMVFALIAKLRLVSWAAFITFATVSKLDRLSLRKIFNVIARR